MSVGRWIGHGLTMGWHSFTPYERPRPNPTRVTGLAPRSPEATEKGGRGASAGRPQVIKRRARK